MGHGRLGRTGARVDGVGLFSVLSFLVEQQAKEIGVGMALGAATKHVVELVLSQLLRPVGIGLAAGGGLAAAVTTLLMATSAASEIGGWVDVFDPVAYAASALVIATASLIAVSVPHPACRPHRSDRDPQKGLSRVTAREARSRLRPYRADEPIAEIERLAKPR